MRAGILHIKGWFSDENSWAVQVSTTASSNPVFTPRMGIPTKLAFFAAFSINHPKRGNYPWRWVQRMRKCRNSYHRKRRKRAVMLSLSPQLSVRWKPSAITFNSYPLCSILSSPHLVFRVILRGGEWEKRSHLSPKYVSTDWKLSKRLGKASRYLPSKLM